MIVRLDTPEYTEPLYYDLDEEFEELETMIWDIITRCEPMMITSKEE